MTPDPMNDWVRVQVYMPEEIRYFLRTKKPDYKSDSLWFREVLLAVSRLNDIEFESLMNNDESHSDSTYMEDSE
jgi:hypothetical protein